MPGKALIAKLTPAAASALLIFLYNDWILAPLLNPALSTRASLISEISARTQPYHWAFQVLDLTSGILSVALLPCLWRLLRWQPPAWRWLLFVGVALIGADSVIDALLPMSCAPSIDTHCTAVALQSAVTNAHMIESTLGGGITFVAPALWWLCLRKRQPLLAETSRLFVVLQTGVGLGVVLAHHNEAAVVGLLQRFYQLCIGAWMALVLSTSIHAVQKQHAHKPRLLPANEPAEP